MRKYTAMAMSLWIGIYPIRGVAEDIDIFVGSSAGSHDNPNVLIVLDNTANWARQSQQWPGGVQQGQSEVSAIKSVVSTLSDQINVGLFEFVTEGNANDDGGKVRYNISAMSAANKTSLSAILDTTYGDINGVLEKRSSGTPYGNLIYDAYNYLAGENALNAGAVGGTSRVDDAGYTTTYSKFKSPLSPDNACAKNYVIFVSNPNSSGPSSDAAANKTALAALGGDTATISLPNMSTSTVNTTSSIGNTGECYSTLDSKASCNAKLSSTANITAAPAETSLTACGDGTYTSCACDTAVTEGACATGQKYSVIGTLLAGTTNLGYTTGCYSNTSSCNTDDYTAQCTGTGLSCACSTSAYVTTGCTGSKKKFMVQLTRANTTATNLGYTSACYDALAACSTADYAGQCTAYNSCACSTPTTTGGACAANTSKFSVTATSSETYATPNGTYSTTAGASFYLDEWARFMYQVGVPVTGSTDKQKVSTYTIDVFNKQQNSTHSALMISTAKAGGGKYFTATNEAALVNALKQIFAEIESVNSTFASASLPVNATNRAQNENQVFIGMFRPDPEAKPRWFGNLKRYQLILGADGVTVELGDRNGTAAVNNNTGFITDCASSWWTSDSGTYWQSYPVNPSPAGTCTTTANSAYSDEPDGPRVEKGAVAEVIRKGNNPTATDTTPTWTVSRTVYGTADSASTTMTALSGLATLSTTTKNWTLGEDTENEDTDANTTETRASIHGDVIHSRPMPINYGSSVVVYYGANDGMFRAVDAETGKEVWSFLPSEFNTKLERLRTNSPLVSYPSVDMTITPTPTAKDYFWDGSIGVFQNTGNTKVWIYPTMRRGGRMVYALDVTTAATPSIKWKAGCPNAADDTGCTSGMTGIGQTWSIPNVAPIKGYSTTNYAIFMGGGYDTCEDANSSAPSCGSPKGAGVYILDAETGSILKTLATTRSVAADVSVIDMDGDGYADYAYVLDTGGNLYRITMVTRSTDAAGTVTYAPLAAAAWTINRVAYTNGGAEGRKFLFAPALLGTTPKIGKVYVAMGTGDREHPLSTHYPFGSVTNRFYVFVDDLSSTAANDLDDAATMNDYTADAGCNATQITPGSGKKGWFMNLNQYGTGEQSVTSALIVGGLITFSTNRPIAPAAGTCSTPLGEARGYWVNLLNGSGAIGVDGSCGGSRSGVMVGGGLPPSPVIGTVPVGGKVTTVVLGAAQKGGGANTPISPQKAKPTISSTRKRVYLYSTGDN